MPIDKFLDLAAEFHADMEAQIADNEAKYALRIEEILTRKEERDEEVFEVHGAEVDIDLEDLFNVPVYQRDIQWMNMFAAILSAARIQAWVELFGIELIELIETSGQAMNSQGKSMHMDELKQISSKKDLKKRIAKAREAKYGQK